MITIFCAADHFHTLPSITWTERQLTYQSLSMERLFVYVIVLNTFYIIAPSSVEELFLSKY